jgi:hypothetical protein
VKLASGVSLGLPHLGPAPPSGTIRHDAHTVRPFIWLCKTKEAKNGKDLGGRELTCFQ